jgi:hypothetical protein
MESLTATKTPTSGIQIQNMENWQVLGALNPEAFSAPPPQASGLSLAIDIFIGY